MSLSQGDVTQFLTKTLKFLKIEIILELIEIYIINFITDEPNTESFSKNRGNVFRKSISRHQRIYPNSIEYFKARLGSSNSLTTWNKLVLFCLIVFTEKVHLFFEINLLFDLLVSSSLLSLGLFWTSKTNLCLLAGSLLAQLCVFSCFLVLIIQRCHQNCID